MLQNVRKYKSQNENTRKCSFSGLSRSQLLYMYIFVSQGQAPALHPKLELHAIQQRGRISAWECYQGPLGSGVLREFIAPDQGAFQSNLGCATAIFCFLFSTRSSHLMPQQDHDWMKGAACETIFNLLQLLYV